MPNVKLEENGVYVTRNGCKAICIGKHLDGSRHPIPDQWEKWPYIIVIDTYGDEPWTFAEDGYFRGADYPESIDIVGPWMEPELDLFDLDQAGKVIARICGHVGAVVVTEPREKVISICEDSGYRIYEGPNPVYYSGFAYKLMNRAFPNLDYYKRWKSQATKCWMEIRFRSNPDVVIEAERPPNQEGYVAVLCMYKAALKRDELTMILRASLPTPGEIPNAAATNSVH